MAYLNFGADASRRLFLSVPRLLGANSLAQINVYGQVISNIGFLIVNNSDSSTKDVQRRQVSSRVDDTEALAAVIKQGGVSPATEPLREFAQSYSWIFCLAGLE
jgi:hypothetical protein